MTPKEKLQKAAEDFSKEMFKDSERWTVSPWCNDWVFEHAFDVGSAETLRMVLEEIRNFAPPIAGTRPTFWHEVADGLEARFAGKESKRRFER